MFSDVAASPFRDEMGKQKIKGEKKVLPSSRVKLARH